MSFLEAFHSALGALRSNKLRTALTLLGMIIGVFAVITSVTAVEVVKVYFEESLDLLGNSTFSIQREPAVQFSDNREYRSRRPITYEQVERLDDMITMPLTISVEEDFDVTAVHAGAESTEPNVFILGGDENYNLNFAYDLADGRSFTGADVLYARPVAMLGASVAKELFEGQQAIGKDIRVRGRRYRVIGVLDEKGSFLGFDFDNRVVVPITTAFNQYGQPWRNIASVSVRTASARDVPAAMEHVIGHMRTVRKVPPGKPNDFEVETNDSIQGTFDTFTGILTTGGAGIGLIALLAAGIGVMNIMLVSVTERTREIGIRKSIGARRRDITRQFLLEAIVMCQIGGLIGIALGVLFGNAVAYYFEISAAFPVGWAIAGIVAVTVIAVVFGGYPAIKAARLDPVDSLRYE